MSSLLSADGSTKKKNSNAADIRQKELCSSRGERGEIRGKDHSVSHGKDELKCAIQMKAKSWIIRPTQRKSSRNTDICPICSSKTSELQGPRSDFSRFADASLSLM